MKRRENIDACIYLGNDFNDISMFVEAIKDDDFIVIVGEQNKTTNAIKEYLQDLLVLSDYEKEFVKEFTNKNYRPELLFEDKEIVERISAHPMALWRVRENNN